MFGNRILEALERCLLGGFGGGGIREREDVLGER